MHIIQKVLKFYLYVLTLMFIRMRIFDKDFKVGLLVDLSMLLKVFYISFICLFWKLVRATDFARLD